MIPIGAWWLAVLLKRAPPSNYATGGYPISTSSDPLVLHPAKPTRKSKRQPTSTSLPRLNTEMPAEPRYGFSGRARELLQVERHLLRGKLVVIFGFGGIGKTALAREAADWLTRTDMYAGACFVSFEHGGDTGTLLSALGHFLYQCAF